MRAKKIEHGRQRARLAQRSAQVIRRQTGQGQETRGAIVVDQDPAKRVQRQCRGIVR